MDRLFIITNLGTKYPVKWSGVSTIDGCLRFAVTGISFNDAFFIFSNTDNTSKLIYEFDGTVVEEYDGYTNLVGIQSVATGITIALKGA